MKAKQIIRGALGATLLGALSVNTPTANAVGITVDTVLADVAGQTASINMTVAGDVLTVTFVNTTGAGGPIGADGLLTGLAFNLPDAIDILTAGSGTTVGAGSFIRGGSLDGSGAGTSVSGEWGYANGVSGHFNGLAVDTQVSTMEADTTTAFGSPIDNPAVLNGPEYGMMRTGGDRGGLTAIENSVVFTLKLSGAVGVGDEAAFLAAIDAGEVAVTFGSPGTTVPDAGSTLALLGLAFGSFGFLRRKLS